MYRLRFILLLIDGKQKLDLSDESPVLSEVVVTVRRHGNRIRRHAGVTSGRHRREGQASQVLDDVRVKVRPDGPQAGPLPVVGAVVKLKQLG